MNVYNSTSRFSNRANHYDLYRPGYPEGIIAYLEKNIGLNKDFRIADIGSGTGIFSSLFLELGYPVFSVEPNQEMRLRAERNLNAYSLFTSINGTAEQTTLADHTVDLITVAQAFHWFNLDEIKGEFNRILKPGGYTLLVWNILQEDTPFLNAYANLKDKYGESMAHPSRANLENIRQFFYPSEVLTKTLRFTQFLDDEGLKGHLLSFSTIPLPGDPNYAAMMLELGTLCAEYAENGMLKMEYNTMIYLAKS